MIEKVDITERATGAGWTLPDGFQVLAWTEHDDDWDNPRDKGDVYNTDFEEEDYSNPTRGLCRGCEAVIYKLDQNGADAINHAVPADADPDDPAYMDAWAGMWANKVTGVSCPESTTGHELDDPVVVRWWREDRWEFVTALVEVTDDEGRVWGMDSLGGVESGTFPVQIDPETGEITSKEIDPLTDPDHPLPDMIGQALAEAAAALDKHAENMPTITAPKAESVTTEDSGTLRPITISRELAEQVREAVIEHFRLYTYDRDGNRLPDEQLPRLFEPGHNGSGWDLAWEGHGPYEWTILATGGGRCDSGLRYEPVTWPAGVFAEPINGVELGLYPS